MFERMAWVAVSIACFGVVKSRAGALSRKEVMQVQGLHQLELQELIKQCDVTQTAGGPEALARLTRPSASVEMPIKRQKMMQHFLANVQARERIIEVLSGIAAAESSTMQYAKEVNETFIEVAHFYRSRIMPESLKNSPTCLRLLYYSKLLGNAAAMFSWQAFSNVGWAYLRDCSADGLHRLDAVKREVVDLGQGNFFQDLAQARSPEEMDRIMQQNIDELNRIEHIFNAPSERERGGDFSWRQPLALKILLISSILLTQNLCRAIKILTTQTLWVS